MGDRVWFALTRPSSICHKEIDGTDVWLLGERGGSGRLSDTDCDRNHAIVCDHLRKSRVECINKNVFNRKL